jgi:hypothetical protein
MGRSKPSASLLGTSLLASDSQKKNVPVLHAVRPLSTFPLQASPIRSKHSASHCPLLFSLNSLPLSLCKILFNIQHIFYNLSTISTSCKWSHTPSLLLDDVTSRENPHKRCKWIAVATWNPTMWVNSVLPWKLIKEVMTDWTGNTSRVPSLASPSHHCRSRSSLSLAHVGVAASVTQLPNITLSLPSTYQLLKWHSWHTLMEWHSTNYERETQRGRSLFWTKFQNIWDSRFTHTVYLCWWLPGTCRCPQWRMRPYKTTGRHSPDDRIPTQKQVLKCAPIPRVKRDAWNTLICSSVIYAAIVRNHCVISTWAAALHAPSHYTSNVHWMSGVWRSVVLDTMLFEYLPPPGTEPWPPSPPADLID